MNALPGAAVQEGSRLHGAAAGQGSHSHSSGGETGSHASTSDATPYKAPEVDMETTSVQVGRSAGCAVCGAAALPRGLSGVRWPLRAAS